MARGKPSPSSSSSKKTSSRDAEAPEADDSVEEVEDESASEDTAGSDSDIQDCMDDDGDDDDDDEQEQEEEEEEQVTVIEKKSTGRTRSDDSAEDANVKTEKISNLIQKVFFAHKNISETGWDSVETVQVTHPRTKLPALILLHTKNADTADTISGKGDQFLIYEVLTMTQDTRSWFVGDNVVSDGNVYAFTPMDSLFLIAFAMSKSKQARPLFDHLEEVFPGKMAKVLSQRVPSSQLENIATRKTVSDIEAYLSSESNTLSWLSQKVRKVADFLKRKDISSSESSVSINFTKASDPKSSESTEYLRYAAEIVCEYVDEELQAKLFAKLGLPIVRPKRKISNEDETGSKKLKTVDNIQPLEDYGSSSKATPQSAVKAGRGKAKAAEFEKAAKGTHLLSKFFQVKPKS